MEFTRKYIEQTLKFRDHFVISDDEVEIVDIVRTRGNIGFYVKWNSIYHPTGGIITNFDYEFVSNKAILRRFYYDFRCNDVKERKKKLLLIKLNNELSENN